MGGWWSIFFLLSESECFFLDLQIFKYPSISTPLGVLTLSFFLVPFLYIHPHYAYLFSFHLRCRYVFFCYRTPPCTITLQYRMVLPLTKKWHVLLAQQMLIFFCYVLHMYAFHLLTNKNWTCTICDVSVVFSGDGEEVNRRERSRVPQSVH